MVKIDFSAYKKWMPLALAIAIMVLVFIMPAFLNLVNFLGHRIPQDDVRPDYIIGIVWAVFLGLTILIWPVRSQDKKALLWIWAIKSFVMLVIMLFYENHYPLDSFGYFAGGRHNMNEWRALEIGGTSSPVVFIAWLHNNLLFNSYHAVKVSFGMIGLVAIYIYYRAVVAFLQQEKIMLLYILAFFPSILFWSSILGKEPIIILSIAVYCYGAIKFIRTLLVRYIIVLLLGVMLAAFMRVWLGLILILPILTIAIFLHIKSFKKKAMILLVLIFVSLFFFSQFMTYFHLRSAKELPHLATQGFNSFARGGSAIGKKMPAPLGMKDTLVSMPEKAKSGSLKDMVLLAPKGMFTTLFRPLPGEVRNIFGLLAGLEDAFLVVLFFLAVKRARWKEITDPVIVWAILLIVVWAAAYGFVGFNLGTICRYRVQILPVFLGVLLYQARSRSENGTQQ